jgi:hypothetical protein
VKKTKVETVKKVLAKAGYGESDVADNLDEASGNISVISYLCRGKELAYDTKNFVRSDDHLTTRHSFESATALLGVRNTQNEDVDDEEEEKEEERGEEASGEQDISTKIRTPEESLHCISEVMQLVVDSNSFSLLELLYTVKDCIEKNTNTKKRKQIFISSLLCNYVILESVLFHL